MNPNSSQFPGAWPYTQPNNFDNYTAPPMTRGNRQSSNDRRSFSSAASDTRPGHFPDLSTFARCDREGVQLQGIVLQDATFAGLAPGSIIRIADVENSRLHNRVMLVIRTNRSGSTLSMTCLSFCQHPPRRSVPNDFAFEHASVVCARSEPPLQHAGDGLSRLRVFIGSDDSGFKPQPEVWINIREIWNVDFMLAVAVLGEAEPESFRRLLHDVKRVFCSTLGDVDRVETMRRRDSDRQRHETALASSPEGDGPNLEGARPIRYHQQRGLFGTVRIIEPQSRRRDRTS